MEYEELAALINQIANTDPRGDERTSSAQFDCGMEEFEEHKAMRDPEDGVDDRSF
jgi:hypothetical protein